MSTTVGNIHLRTLAERLGDEAYSAVRHAAVVALGQRIKRIRTHMDRLRPARLVLDVAPTGRDALLLANSLAPAGIQTQNCPDSTQLLEALQRGAAAALVAEEALDRQDVSSLSNWLTQQPTWSDMPLIYHQCPRARQRGNRIEGADTADARERHVRGTLGTAGND